ncbi:hypothetical protein SNEBB_010589 [Seison nebaliae]|nr:hypothetical protein SNEBB_010589 [Seison nebaliae]
MDSEIFTTNLTSLVLNKIRLRAGLNEKSETTLNFIYTSITLSSLSVLFLLYSFYYHMKKFFVYRNRLASTETNMKCYVSLQYLQLLIIYRNVIGLAFLVALIGRLLLKYYHDEKQSLCRYFCNQISVTNAIYFVVQIMINLGITRIYKNLKEYGRCSDSDYNNHVECGSFSSIVKLVKGRFGTSYENIIGTFIIQIISLTIIATFTNGNIFKNERHFCFKPKQNFLTLDTKSLKILIASSTFLITLATVITLMDVHKNQRLDQTYPLSKWIYGQLSAFRLSQITYSSFLTLSAIPWYFFVLDLTVDTNNENNIFLNILTTFVGMWRGCSFILELIFFKYVPKLPSESIPECTSNELTNDDRFNVKKSLQLNGVTPNYHEDIRPVLLEKARIRDIGRFEKRVSLINERASKSRLCYVCADSTDDGLCEKKYKKLKTEICYYSCQKTVSVYKESPESKTERRLVTRTCASTFPESNCASNDTSLNQVLNYCCDEDLCNASTTINGSISILLFLSFNLINVICFSF